MKKFLALLLCVQLVLCAGVGLAQAAPAAQQADVVIVGAGMGGTIEVTVTAKDGSITDITVGDNAETATVFAAVKSQFIPEMIRQQNLDLDVCSGATFSCEGVREAVKNALGK